MPLRALIIGSIVFGSLCSFATPPIRIGFYNTRNLYDTINDIAVDDADNLPSKNQYVSKIGAIANAIQLFKPTIIGLCEVEKRAVVQDVADRIGGVVLHYDSKDRRGIDVAMIVDTARIEIISSEPIDAGYGIRDFLRADVADKITGTKLTIYVVHLPSQRGGAKANVLRQKAYQFIDSLSYTAQNTIFIGDFNSPPIKWANLHNTAIEPSQKGVGSYAYRDLWSMIDQILISKQLIYSIVSNQNVVVNEKLLTPYGKYRSYPNRNISDHLPIYIDFKL